MPPAKLPFVKQASNSVPVHLVEPGKLSALQGTVSQHAMSWAKATGFDGKHLAQCLIANDKGEMEAVLLGYTKNANPLDFGKLSNSLPAGNYHFAGDLLNPDLAGLGIALGAYRFDRYKSVPDRKVRFSLPDGVDMSALARAVEATCLVRDLINTPTNDMGPGELEKAFRELGSRFKAKVTVIKGDDLLKKNFPMIHAVGRASTDAPRLLDMKWGKAGDPKVTLVGKGVCFDTGGLNIKPGSSMALMKRTWAVLPTCLAWR